MRLGILRGCSLQYLIRRLFSVLHDDLGFDLLAPPRRESSPDYVDRAVLHPEQSDIPAHSLSSPSEDEGQSGDPPRGLKRLLRERKSPAGDSGSDSMNDANIRPVRQAAV